MARFEIIQTVSGVSLGVYEGEDEDEAIAAMLVDGAPGAVRCSACEHGGASPRLATHWARDETGRYGLCDDCAEASAVDARELGIAEMADAALFRPDPGIHAIELDPAAYAEQGKEDAIREWHDGVPTAAPGLCDVAGYDYPEGCEGWPEAEEAYREAYAAKLYRLASEEEA